MSQTTPYSYTIHSVGASGMTVELRYDGEQFDVFSLLPPPSDYTQVPVLWAHTRHGADRGGVGVPGASRRPDQGPAAGRPGQSSAATD